MAFINFEIRHDGTNVSDHVINYSRFQYICTGIGTLDVQLENINLNRTISPWDIIVLYEDGNKIGTYIVCSAIRSAEGGTVTVQCQDYSKKIVDHFVVEQNQVTYATTTRYWIELFLNEADLDYEFTTATDGEIVGPNASYGLSSAYDLIMSLLQQSGWYIYFDQNGKAIVGELNRAGDHYDSVINDDDILSLERARNDQRLRNRAVVWGAGDPYTGAWIGADISRNTPWNYDSNDKRAVVLSNGMIYSTAVAEDLARKMLNEFSQIANEITVETINHYGVDIGDLVYVRSRYFSGRMMVTTIESMGSKDGLKTKLTLNQKCPRLFAYFGILGEYIPVYIGTWGDGVWKKYTGGSTWTQTSSGLALDALYIIDLFIKNGVLACVTNDGYLYFADIVTNTWTKFEHGDLIDLMVNLYLEPDVRAVCCSIDDMGNIVAGYQYDDGETKRAWVLTISGTGVLIKAEQIIPQAGEDYLEDVKLVDLEAVGYPEEGIIDSILIEDFPISPSILGTKTTQAFYSIDPNCFGIGPSPGDEVTGAISGGGGSLRAGYIIENDDTMWDLISSTSGGGSYALLEYDLTTMTRTNTYSINAPETGRITGGYNIPLSFLYKRTSRIFDIISLDIIYDYVEQTTIGFTVRHFAYTLGNPNLTLVNTQDFYPTYSGGVGIMKGIIQNNTITWAMLSQDTVNLNKKAMDFIIYNVVTASGYAIIATAVDQTGAWEYDYWNRRVLPFFVASGVACFGGFIFWFRQRTGLNFKRLLLLMDGAMVGAAGTFSAFSEGEPIVLLQKDAEKDGIEPDVFIDSLVNGYAELLFNIQNNNYGASNSYNSYIFGEVAIRDYFNNETRDEHWITNYLITIEFPSLQTYSVQSASYIEPNGIDDPTGRFLYRNYQFNEQDETFLLTGAKTSFISSRTYTPLYVRQEIFKSDFSDCYIQIIDPFSFTTVNISLTSLGFSINESQSPEVVVGFYRDDYDGNIYAVIWPTAAAGGVGDGGLYGFNFSGVNTKFIPGWRNPQPNIIKTYAVGTDFIKKYGRSGSLGAAALILKHTSAPFDAGLIGASLDATEQTYGIFEVILQPEQEAKVEISKGVPTVVYSPPWMSGIQQTVPTNYLAASLTNMVNDFYFPPENTYNYYDARVFDIGTTSGAFTIASGILPDSLLERYIALATSGEITLIKYDLTEPFYSLVTMSGLLALASGAGTNPSGAITLFETTNYTLDPYMFVGISGPPSLFFQRGNPYYPYWVNYSYTLPSSDMTIIRVDDSI